MPEIKTRQNQGKPVLNTAQQQMQRSFVKARQEQAAQQRNEQPESPNNYAEEKISRTAEDAVRDGATLAVREIRSLHQRNDEKYDVSAKSDIPEEHQQPPADNPVVPTSDTPEYSRSRPTAQQESSKVFSANPVRTRSHENTTEAGRNLTSSSQQEAGWKAAVERIIRQSQAYPPESADALSPRTVQRTIRTREQPMNVSIPASTAQQKAARKASVQNLVRQKQARKQDELQIERSHFSQQVEASKRNSSTMPLQDNQAVPKSMAQTRSSTVGAVKADGFHNADSFVKGTASKGQIPIKKKSDLPIRTKQGAVPIKTAERASEKAVGATAEKAFREAQKATITAAQKSSHAAATAGRRAMVAAKKAAELAAKLARSAAEAAKALYTAIAAGGVASVLVIVVIVLIGCGAAIFGSQEDDSTEILPLSAEVDAYEPVIRRYARQYGIPDYVLLIQAVMMQESGGRGNDPMQASECGFNTQYPRIPGGITDPEYSIAVGIQNLADCLQTAEAESPIDLDHIQLALQGYNFGSGYITWALQKYGEYSRANAIEFSMKMAEQMGWNSYGDKQYVPHVLRYYPIGKVFYNPEGGDAIVDVALTQVGNVGGEPYWSWYGFTNHVEWCACFVSWCADQCGYLDSGTYPKFSGCVFGMQWFQQRGLWLDGSTEPVPGMLIFFDWATQDGLPDHVGIVEKVENGMVYTVEGNSRDMCRQKQYSLGSGVILGYGMAAG